MEPKVTLDRFADAVVEMLADEGFRYANPGEQAVTGRLSQLMVPRFLGWSVWPEWDRHAHEQKMLYFGFANQVAKLRAIRPDIIVHEIGNDDQNILVVEAKRIENSDDARDKAKLRAMTSAEGGYSYQVGVHLVIDAAHAAIASCEVFVSGHSSDELTTYLRALLPVAEPPQ